MTDRTICLTIDGQEIFCPADCTVYEAAAAGLILWLVWPSRQSNQSPGLYFLQFLAYTAFARLFFEGFRGSSPITLFNLRQAVKNMHI